MMPKKILFLCFSLTALSLTACGGSGDNPFGFGGSGGGNQQKSASAPVNNSIPDFSTLSEAQKAEYGIIPAEYKGTDIVTYGLYPQTAVTDKKVADNISKYATQFRETDWYYYDGSFYAQAKAYTSSGSKFNDGISIETYQNYWFKCEPIQWKKLSSNNGEHYVVSNFIIDAHLYFNKTTGTRLIDGVYINPDNYEYSLLRSWLIDTVSLKAFMLGNSYNKITNVDNSSYSTAESGTNNNACNNTNDRLFVPSRRDLLNTSYGFSENANDNITRLAKVTDWAKATGMDFTSGGYGDYWSRSPSGKYLDGAYAVGHDGVLMTTNVDALLGVRPGMTLLEESIK